jgi:hypothetical protein
MNVLDGGSDLSEISDAESNEISLTPGVASTPRTTPTPGGKNGRTVKQSPHSPLAMAFPEGKESKKRGGSKQSDKDNKSTSRSNDNAGSKNKGKGKLSNRGRKVNKNDYSDGEGPSKGTKQKEDNEESPTQNVPSKAVEAGSSVVKKPSMRGWAYVTEPVSLSKEDTIIEGRRSRKPTMQFANPPKPNRKASSSEVPPSEQPRQTESPLTSAADLDASESKPRIKINIQINTKRKPETALEDVKPAGRDDEAKEDTSASLSSMSPLDDDEDEGVRPTLKKRKRPRPNLKLGGEDDEDDYSEREVEARKSKSKARKSEFSSNKSKTKSKKRREEGSAGSIKRKDDTFAADDASDEYRDGKVSDDDVMSEDDDDEAPSVGPSKAAAPAKESKEAMSSMPRLKRKSDALLGDEAKAAPRHSTGSIPKTVAGLINAFQKPASALLAQNTPVKPPPVKAAIRKVPSMNLFDNLMGFGSSTKDSTPGRSPAVRPRPSGGTPQGTSPMVRPPGSVKKDDEAPASGTATPTRMHSLLSKPSPLASNGAAKPGANGEHVTAAEMAIRKKHELQANANPTGLFDLLEGAEIMMQFEAETRDLLSSDAVIAKYKLYKASRTDGLSKLVDRIKETNRSKMQAQTPDQISDIAT